MIVLATGITLALLLPRPMVFWFYWNEAYFQTVVTTALQNPGAEQDCFVSDTDLVKSCNITWVDDQLFVEFEKSFYWRLIYADSEAAILKNEYLFPQCTFDGSIIERIGSHWFICEVDWM